jgi:hypothetical protein
MIEMLKEARFSTSTSPWRSNITPRGARQPFGHREADHAEHAVADRLDGDGGQRVREASQSQHGIRPHEEHGVRGGRCRERQQAWHGGGHDELRAKPAHQEADDGLRQPPHPENTGGQGILHESSKGTGQQTGDRAAGERHVDHDDQHQVHRDGATPDTEPAERRLGQERRRQSADSGQDLHFAPSPGG